MNPPYIHCPFCKIELSKKPFGETKRFYLICPSGSCNGNYVQYHTEGGDFDYLKFDTSKYSIAIYFNSGEKSMMYGSTIVIGTYIYSLKVLHKMGIASPLAVIKKNDYDFSDWNKLAEKIHTYVVML